MADREDSSDSGTILLGPGARPALLLPLLRALRPTAEARVRQLEDLGALLGEQAPGGFLLLDADELPLEDLGLVRRFLERSAGAGWLLLLTGDDPAAPAARRLLARAVAGTWLPWPIDVEELQAVARGAGSAAPRVERAASAEAGATGDREVQDREVQGTQEGDDPGPAPRGPRDDLERRLVRELRAIESILRDEEGLLPELDAPAGGEGTSSGGALADPPLSGLELSREEMEAFLGPLEPAPPERPEAARGERLDPDGVAERAAREISTATETSPDPPDSPSASTDDVQAPPVWYRAQVADLADLAQGLGLSLHALREANEEEGDDAAVSRDEAIEGVANDVYRLVQFTRTLGFLAAPPGPGDRRLALATLVEEQLGGLAGAGPDSPRYLFRADDEVEVRCDKALVVQALDALLQVADACADATDVVRVAVHDGDGHARLRIDFPAGPAAGVPPSRALQPYGLRRELPTIGPNALAAASRLFAGQGGRLSLGRGGPGRLVFEADLPKA